MVGVLWGQEGCPSESSEGTLGGESRGCGSLELGEIWKDLE